MTLDKCKRGQKLKIMNIPNELIRLQAIRFGISEGSIVTCEEVVPAGPVVVGMFKQQIAIGRDLARNIAVQPI
ncbi:ferrous iron transport protein A [Desulforamulus aquiferis]|uniref:Ferrous iron transport protein A n=1 Tax=Desulforamulus aquiferis TaxID=1397668 RepID=A0AAW7ZF54_9FIRM|nr:ferrous iron transport protein A [Desulforamulus aquiferis]MDO7788026.1 ferrous iron transport protein A [Desulforamulus aquiferis]RYD04691.1 iron transporter [Desulforamulus aquiferis]